MKSRLQDDDIEMHSRRNKEKPAVFERFIRTLKAKFRNIGIRFQKLCISTTITNIIAKSKSSLLM